MNSSILFMLIYFDCPWYCYYWLSKASRDLILYFLWYSTSTFWELVMFLWRKKEELSPRILDILIFDYLSPRMFDDILDILASEYDPSLVFLFIGKSFFTVLRSMFSIRSSSRILFVVPSPEADLLLKVVRLLEFFN